MNRILRTLLLSSSSAALLLCQFLPAKAQLVRDTALLKPLPNITSWADNEHYIVEKYLGKVKSHFLVAIQTGKSSELAEKQVASVSVQVEIIKGDVYFKSDNINKQLTKTDAEEKLPLLSPDKKWVAFLRNNDLFAIEVESGKEIRFTTDGSATILNGYASWVYYEEILKRESNYRAFWWSPDSKYVAFYRFDDGKVPVFPLYNALGQHGSTELTHYPKAGDPNPSVKLGFASVNAAQVIWADFDEKADQYFGKPLWRPNSKGLIVQWLPRRQNNLKLFDVDPLTGKSVMIYQEKNNTWIDWVDRLYWVNDDFLMVRDFDGWEQIYYHSANGQLKRKLTQGKNWEIEIVRIDQKNGLVYFKSNAEQSTRTDFYCVDMAGKDLKRLTFGAYNHEKVLLSPDGKHLITQYSNTTTPPKISLVNLANGKQTLIADAKGKSFEHGNFKNRELIWMDTKEGYHLPAIITWPKGFEKEKKYPLVIQVYGGPKHQSVADKWVTPFTVSEEKQEIRVIFDHRGSGHAGKQGLDQLYGNLGKWEMEDYISWMRLLLKNPSIDANKVMISGGSYGGYLTSLALTYGSAYFHYGIADYPVTDWKLYDSHYTERYMGLPQDNPKGYAFGSVLNHVDAYQKHGPSMLLIQHGVMDDNVHIQNTYQLIDLLQRRKKTFQMMVYPTERHGWLGPKISFVVANKNQFENQYLFNNTKK